MTNEEFIRRLKKARKLALTRYFGCSRIGIACGKCGISWSDPFGENNAVASIAPVYVWLRDHGNTEANVRAVFDNSIRALGGKP